MTHKTAVYIVICFPSNELLFISVHVSRMTGGLARLSTDRDGRMWAGRTRKCAHVRAERTSARPPASRCSGQTSDARAWESGRPRPEARPRLTFLKSAIIANWLHTHLLSQLTQSQIRVGSKYSVFRRRKDATQITLSTIINIVWKSR